MSSASTGLTAMLFEFALTMYAGECLYLYNNPDNVNPDHMFSLVSETVRDPQPDLYMFGRKIGRVSMPPPQMGAVTLYDHRSHHTLEIVRETRLLFMMTVNEGVATWR